MIWKRGLRELKATQWAYMLLLCIFQKKFIINGVRIKRGPVNFYFFVYSIVGMAIAKLNKRK
jgi:hypothetical protein